MIDNLTLETQSLALPWPNCQAILLILWQELGSGIESTRLHILHKIHVQSGTYLSKAFMQISQWLSPT